MFRVRAIAKVRVNCLFSFFMGPDNLRANTDGLCTALMVVGGLVGLGLCSKSLIGSTASFLLHGILPFEQPLGRPFIALMVLDELGRVAPIPHKEILSYPKLYASRKCLW